MRSLPHRLWRGLRLRPWLLHRQDGLVALFQRRWRLNLALAIGLMAASLAIAGLTPSLKPISDAGTHLLGAVCYALATWTATFAMVGAAMRFLSGYSAARRYIADASYWIYLVHLPIILALQVVVAPLDWPWPVKYAVILAVAFPPMLASYELFVRHGLIGAILQRTAGSAPPCAGLADSPGLVHARL